MVLGMIPNPKPCLPSALMRMLEVCRTKAAGRTSEELQAGIQAYLQHVQAKRMDQPWLNVALATAIAERLITMLTHQVAAEPDDLSWTLAAAIYFIARDDDDNDFSSPIGFEDDAEVLNACLTYANRPDLCLRVQDYDHG